MQVDVFESPEQVLQQLSENLPLLEHLDVSGTNLPGNVNVSEQSALPGWPSDRKLSFLGLMCCPSEPGFRQNLPAHRITGDANEEQLTAALEAYADWRHATGWIIRLILRNFAYMNATHRAPGHLFELLLERMQRYLSVKYVQSDAPALLFHLLLLLDVENISPMRVRTLVQRLVETLERSVRAMDPAIDIVHNCFAVLSLMRTYDQIRVPSYHLLYERLLTVLLLIAQRPRSSLGNYAHVKFIALDLLRSILLHPMHLTESKLLLEKLDGLRVLLEILKQVSLDEEISPITNQCEVIAVLCWLLVSFATDESASNCRKFIDLGGLELFINCVKRWPDSINAKELKRTMLLALTNIAEMKLLRGYLKSDELIAIFLEMLDTTDPNDNGISYNTAGVLSHMLADGEDLWHHKAGCEDADEARLPVPLAYSRAAIGERIIAATERWNPDVACNTTITYTSLIPTLSLITAFDSFASQYWAAWALNNLSLVNPDVYCPMLFREGALDRLDTAIADARCPDRLRHWLVLTADRIRQHIK